MGDKLGGYNVIDKDSLHMGAETIGLKGLSG